MKSCPVFRTTPLRICVINVIAVCILFVIINGNGVKGMANLVLKIMSEAHSTNGKAFQIKDSHKITIKTTPNVKYVIVDEESGRSPDKIQIQKLEDDLFITFDNGAKLIIQDYYVVENNEILGMLDGYYYSYDYNVAEQLTPVEDLLNTSKSTQYLGGEQHASPWWQQEVISDSVVTSTTHNDKSSMILPLAGLAGIGVLGAAIGGGGGSSSDSKSSSNNDSDSNNVEKNHKPTEIKLDGNSVDENKAGAIVGELTTVDVDRDDSFTYTVSDERFEVVDGKLKLKDGVSLDFEQAGKVEVTIISKDSAGEEVSINKTITVNDVNEKPTDVILSKTEISENSDVVGAIYIADDKQTNYSYEVSDDRFEVVNGYLRLKSGIQLDYETEKQIEIDLAVNDGEFSINRNFTIDVKDVLENTILTGDEQDNTLGFADSNDIYRIEGGAGNDTLIGGNNKDILRGGAGIDTMDGGAGDDTFIVVGDLSIGGKVDSEKDTEVLGFDLTTLNGKDLNEDSDGAIEVIKGGDGEDTLYIYGTADISNYEMSGIENVIIRSDVTFTTEQINNIQYCIQGDGLSVLRISNPNGGAQEVDLSSIELSGIGHLSIGENVTVKFSDVKQLGGVVSISGSGTLSTNNEAVNLGDIAIETGVTATLIDNDGNGIDQIQGGVYVQSTDFATVEIDATGNKYVLIEGDEYNNHLYGYRTDDVIIGGMGSDEISGSEGDDQIWGDEGPDKAMAIDNDNSQSNGGNNGTDTSGNPVVNPQLSSNNLVNNLGGEAGFGEFSLARNDDGSSGAIDVSSVFGEDGLNFFGTSYNSLYVNNNGNITFASGLSTYTPGKITAGVDNPIIAAFWADVDTRAGEVDATEGGNSTGSNLVWYDLDAKNKTFTATWDDVGYYKYNTDKLNAFQIQLVGKEKGEFDIIYRYEDVNWTTGDASDGSGGLGGTVARAGYSSGNGVDYYEMSESGNEDKILSLEDDKPKLFAVSNGHVLETATSDEIYAGDGNDTIVGGRGDDFIDGEDGEDTAKYLLNKEDYQIIENGMSVKVKALRGNEGTDTLVDVEKIVFADGEEYIVQGMLKTAEEVFDDLETGGYYSTMYNMCAVVYDDTYADASTKLAESGLRTLDATTLSLINDSNYSDGIYTSEYGKASVNICRDALFISFSNDSAKDATSVELYDSFAPLINAVDEFIKKSDDIKTVYVAGHGEGGGTVERYMNEHSDNDFSVAFEGITYSAVPYTANTGSDFDSLYSYGEYDSRLNQFEWNNSWSSDLAPNKGNVINLFNVASNGWLDVDILSDLKGAWHTLAGNYSSMKFFEDISQHFDKEFQEDKFRFDFSATDKAAGRVFIPFDLDTTAVSTNDSEHELATIGKALLQTVHAIKSAGISYVAGEATTVGAALWSLKDTMVSLYDLAQQSTSEQVLFGGYGVDDFIGGNGDDNLIGSDKNDSLAGGKGNDVLVGSKGDDVLDKPNKIDSIPDALATILLPDDLQNILNDIANVGIDQVMSQLVMNFGPEFKSENLDLYTALFGTAGVASGAVVKSVLVLLADLYIGQAIDGFVENFTTRNLGEDTLIGGEGNDTYFINSIGDKVIDSSGDLDTVVLTDWSAPTTSRNGVYVLPTGIEVGILKDDVWSPSEDFRMSVSASDVGLHYLVGNAGNNILQGGKGQDVIMGGADEDVLIGNDGNDTLVSARLDNSTTIKYGLNEIPNEVLERIDTYASAWTFDGHDVSYLYGGKGNDTMIGGGDNDFFFVDVNAGIGSDSYSNTDNVDRIIDFKMDDITTVISEDYLVFSAEQLGFNFDTIRKMNDNWFGTNDINESIEGVNINGYHWFSEYDGSGFFDRDYPAFYKVDNISTYTTMAKEDSAPVFVLDTSGKELYFDLNGPIDSQNDLVKVAEFDSSTTDLYNFDVEQIIIMENFGYLDTII